MLLSPASQRGRDFGIILRSFYDNGYAVEWRVINAGEYGLPQKRRRIYIVAYHKSTKYYKKLKKYNIKDIITKEGIFYKPFPIKDEIYEDNTTNISKEKYIDLVDVSNNFQTKFYNSGIMFEGNIYTAKVDAILSEVYPLRKIRENKFL